MWPISTSPNAAPGKGSRPVASWNIITPSEYTSLRASMSCVRPLACSGDMYAGVPITMPVCVLPVETPSELVSLAMPKSTTLTKFFFPLSEIR